MNYRKGAATRQNIVSNARIVLNKKGINLTLVELAEFMGVALGTITNHFRTKDHLFVAISQEYQEQYLHLKTNIDWDKEISLRQVTKYFSAIMDLQYEYRCAIFSAASTSSSQKELYGQIRETYKLNRANSKKMVALFVKGGIFNNSILDKKRYEIFSFLTINVMTTWLISLEMYDKEKGYKKMKFIYLQGVFSCFEPYFTDAAKKEWNKFNRRYL